MTKPRKLSLAEWVSLVRYLDERTWESDGLAGVLRITDSDIESLFKALLANGNDFPCQIVDGDPDVLRVGSCFRLHLGLPRLGLGYVVRDLDVWLRHENARCGRMERWYVADVDWLSGEDHPTFGPAYRAMLDLIAVLEQGAAVVDKAEARLVFLRGERLDLPVVYGRDELEALNVDAIKKITSFAANEDGHTVQRQDILATAVCDLVRDIPEPDRFRYLLNHLPELFARFSDGYSLFAASFSYEKVCDQVEGWRVEHTTRIHKALSDIQGQLLGIPISTIVVATQMKEATAPGGVMWANVAVLVGALVFVCLLFLALRNQWHTLDVLSSEVQRHESTTEKECASIAPRFVTVYSGLRDRIKHQHWILLAVGCVSLLGFGLAFVMFWAMTAPALAIFWQ